MGAGYRSTEFDGNLTREQLSRRFAEFKGEQEYECGCDSYNGTLSTTSGLKVEDRVFDAIEEADRYIADNTRKWENALAVRFNVKEVAFDKEPTFNGRKYAKTESVFGNSESLALRSRWSDGKGRFVVSPADQFTPTQKARLLKLWLDYKSARNTAGSLAKELQELCHKFGEIDWEPTTEDYRRLKSIRPALRKAKAKAKKAKKSLVELDGKLGERLFKREDRIVGVRWLVGGWCAE